LIIAKRPGRIKKMRKYGEGKARNPKGFHATNKRDTIEEQPIPLSPVRP
jgi:hypothetical protein